VKTETPATGGKKAQPAKQVKVAEPAPTEEVKTEAAPTEEAKVQVVINAAG